MAGGRCISLKSGEMAQQIPVNSIIKAKAKNFARSLVRGNFISIMKFIVGIIIVSLFAVGIFLLAFRVFSYLSTVVDIGVLLVDKAIALIFLAFGLMLLLSNAIVAISTLFRSPETAFLLTTPLSYAEVFAVKFFDNLFFSSWATLVVTLPIIIAYGVVFKVHLIYLLLIILLSLTAFIVLPAFLGTLSAILIYLVIGRIGKRTTLLLTLLLALIVTFSFFRSGTPSSLLLNIQGDIRLLNYYLKSLATLSNPWLPNIWLTESLRAGRYNNPTDFLFWVALLISTALAGWVILISIVKRAYFPSFLAAGASRGVQKKQGKVSLASAFWRGLLSPFPKDMQVVITKDFYLFVRDPSQWTQFLLLFSLLILYLVNLRFVPLKIRDPFWQTIISFTNMGFSGYILATLSVRFVFPSVSMEGRSLWKILSSPMSPSRLFWSKFLSSAVIFFILAELIAIISNIMLAQGRFMMFLTSLTVFVMSISLTALNTGLGALLPSYEETNPGKIASSGGGMIAALLSLAYVAITVVILALPTHQYSLYLVGKSSSPSSALITSLLLLILLNIIVIYIPLKLGVRALGNWGERA